LPFAPLPLILRERQAPNEAEIFSKMSQRGRKRKTPSHGPNAVPEFRRRPKKKVKGDGGVTRWQTSTGHLWPFSRPFCCVMLNKSPPTENRTLDMDLASG